MTKEEVGIGAVEYDNLRRYFPGGRSEILEEVTEVGDQLVVDKINRWIIERCARYIAFLLKRYSSVTRRGGRWGQETLALNRSEERCKDGEDKGRLHRCSFMYVACYSS